MYADNELKQTDRKAVEAFVAENTDLKVEFELMMQMKLDPDDQIGFPEKAGLYKPIVLQEDQFQPDEKQLELLMYLDNEMEEEGRLKFEQRLKTDKKLRADFDVLLNTRVEPDFKVKFPDKSLLYRQKEKTGKIIQITWVRIAAAATVILIAGLLWLNRNTSSETSPTIARVESVQNNTKTGKTDSPTTLPSGTDVKKDQKGTGSEPGIDKEEIPVLATTKNVKTGPGKSESKQKLTELENNNGIVSNRKTNNLSAPADNKGSNSVQPAEINNNESALNKQEIASNNLPVVSENTNTGSDNSKANISYAAATSVKSNYATEALLQEDAAMNNKDSQIQDDEKPRKGALRGVFRKANRIFNKVTNPDPSIPSVRVAGFEIALAQ